MFSDITIAVIICFLLTWYYIVVATVHTQNLIYAGYRMKNFQQSTKTVPVDDRIYIFPGSVNRKSCSLCESCWVYCSIYRVSRNRYSLSYLQSAKNFDSIKSAV